MKKVLSAIGISLILTAILLGSSSAALPGTGWWTTYRVQNLADAPGSLSMTAYDQTTGDYGSDSFAFDPNTSLVYNPGVTANYPTGNLIGFSAPLPSGFLGSVVLSSEVPAASVVEVANYLNGSVGGSGTATAMYQGVSGTDVATTLLVPTVKNNYSGQTTTMYVQAAGGDAEATITYTMASGDVYTQTASISENRMFIFDPTNAGVPSTDCGTSTMTSPCYGSAIVTSTTGPIAGVLVEHPHIGSPAPISLAVRLATPNDKSTKVYAPSIKYNYVTSTGTGVSNAVVLNAGSEPAYVRITLTVTALGKNASGVSIGDVFTYDAVVDPDENYNFSQWNNNLGGMPPGTMAAAVIESLDITVDTVDYDPQPMIGSGNDTKTQPLIKGGYGKIKYALFSSDAATGKAAAPTVKDFFGGRNGSLTVQNVGSAADKIFFKFYEYGTDIVYEFWTLNPIAPGAAINTDSMSKVGATKFENDGTWDFSELSGKEFSAIAYAETGEPIIMLVAEYSPDGRKDVDRYEGISY